MSKPSVAMREDWSGAGSDVRSANLYSVAEDCGIDPFHHPRVTVNWAAVASLTAAMREIAGRTGMRTYQWDDPHFWNVSEEPWIRSQLITIGNALNFRFWRLTGEGEIESMAGSVRGEPHTGSMYMWRRVQLAFVDDNSIASAAFLADITPEAFDHLFADDDTFNPLSVAMGERVANLRDLGEVLLRDWDGRFSNLIEEARESLPRFIRLCARFRAFDDPLAKLTLVNALMQKGSGLAHFREPLLPAIDYQIVKQLLRQGVVVPDPSLTKKLLANVHLDDDEAFQLRSAAMDALLRAGTSSSLPGDYIDNQLWKNRVICSERAPRCDDCPFNSFCARTVDFQRPLQVTRYY